jgi:hypothetical protein
LRQALALSFATLNANAGFGGRIRLGAQRRAGAALSRLSGRSSSQCATERGAIGGAVEYRGGTFRGLGVNVRSQRSTTSKESLTRKRRSRAVAAGVYPRFPQFCAVLAAAARLGVPNADPSQKRGRAKLSSAVQAIMLAIGE